jgi:hypothetical protein
MRMSLRLLSLGFGLVVMLALLPLLASAQSDPAYMQANSEKPQPWPGRVIGQWTENGISALDAERARLVYGTR